MKMTTSIINCDLINIFQNQLPILLEEVGEVIQFAEEQQKKGHYVALYLTYESAPFLIIN